MSLYVELVEAGYADRVHAIIEDNSASIEPSFLGHMEQYEALAKIIPVGRTVIDLGCCFGFQGWYFRNHARYIGVDVGLSDDNLFRIPNGSYFAMTIDEFTQEHRDICEQRNTFAICNYVPNIGTRSLSVFRDLFTYYPQTGDEPGDDIWSALTTPRTPPPPVEPRHPSR